MCLIRKEKSEILLKSGIGDKKKDKGGSRGMCFLVFATFTGSSGWWGIVMFHFSVRIFFQMGVRPSHQLDKVPIEMECLV